jgi:hypothetical protein
MAKPCKGKIELDIRDSVPDWDAVLPGQAPEEARQQHRSSPRTRSARSVAGRAEGRSTT